MTKKEVVERFFDGDNELATEINLTLKEIEIFEQFEWAVLCDNGLRQISGGWSSVTIYDYIEEEDDEAEQLICDVACGHTDDTGSDKSTWTAIYNRKTEKFE